MNSRKKIQMIIMSFERERERERERELWMKFHSKKIKLELLFWCNFQYRHVPVLLVKSASMKTQTCLRYSISSNIFTNEMCFSWMVREAIPANWEAQTVKWGTIWATVPRIKNQIFKQMNELEAHSAHTSANWEKLHATSASFSLRGILEQLGPSWWNNSLRI